MLRTRATLTGACRRTHHQLDQNFATAARPRQVRRNRHLPKEGTAADAPHAAQKAGAVDLSTRACRASRPNAPPPNTPIVGERQTVLGANSGDNHRSSPEAGISVA